MTARTLVGLSLQQSLGRQIAGVWQAFRVVRSRVDIGKLEGIQECGLLAVDVREREGRRGVGAGDLRAGIVGAANDCRIFRVTGLVGDEVREREWKTRTRLPGARTAGDSSRRRRQSSRRTSEGGWGAGTGGW